MIALIKLVDMPIKNTNIVFMRTCPNDFRVLFEKVEHNILFTSYAANLDGNWANSQPSLFLLIFTVFYGTFTRKVPFSKKTCLGKVIGTGCGKGLGTKR
jgi:hypothetical protein